MSSMTDTAPAAEDTTRTPFLTHTPSQLAARLLMVAALFTDVAVPVTALTIHESLTATVVVDGVENRSLALSVAPWTRMTTHPRSRAHPHGFESWEADVDGTRVTLVVDGHSAVTP